MAVVEFKNVSKTFPRHSGRQFLKHHLSRIVFRLPGIEPFYALRDVSFQLNPGESLAIVGSNGAGKSTALTLIAGLTRPNAGSVHVSGRVAALLELGSGFHGDLTGAENVRVNAALLGLSRKETARRFADIVEFSGVEQFIEEPLRTYSTGMVMRLAFAVAVNVDANIILIDEALAVGDQAFQERCRERIFQMREQGRSLICVSHEASLIRSLCDRAVWLDKGHVKAAGSIDEVMDQYQGIAESTPTEGSPVEVA
jgi:ABC-type polysaccharide/polyol phosphate transport system ATPase subunit